ncbi:DUF835 domain-containing protein [Pyrococcus horikoshii]|uniref:DUF835 domain-containing protein n=1 Tax=Pyrococcus horikoshii TaxID=53953 RepID=A0A832WGV5_PYRHR|nr:DUF835 domain-containing protein [Pyrococcus horikoshii]HII60500.1 DUF835 domain-containing protein [Pyrococcus horikoshii]
MEQLILMVPLLVVYVLLFYHYHKSRSNYAIYYALAFLSLGVGLAIESTYLASISFLSFFYWLATIRLLEHLEFEEKQELLYASPVPLAAYIFFPRLLAVIIIFVALSLTGFMMLMKKEKNIKILGALTLILALVSALGEYKSFFRYLSAVIGISIGYVIVAGISEVDLVKIKLSEEFEIKPGIMFLESVPRDLLKVALVFSRRPPEKNDGKWFWITKLEGKNNIGPTDLHKILDLAVKHIKKGGIVIIDCLEYLILENGFERVLKFLAQLRDYAIMYNSTVIILGSLDKLSERERAMLRSSLGDNNV